jgi:hypothetical protein
VDVTSSRSDQSLRRSGRRRRRQRARDLVAHRRCDRRRSLRLQRADHPSWSARSQAPPPRSIEPPTPADAAAASLATDAATQRTDGWWHAGGRSARHGWPTWPVRGAPARLSPVGTARRQLHASLPVAAGRPSPGPDAATERTGGRQRVRPGDVDLRDSWPVAHGGAWHRLRASGAVHRRTGGPGRDIELRLTDAEQ